MFKVGYLLLKKLMYIADYKTFLIKKVQQDINNRRKRLGQSFSKIKSKIHFFKSKKMSLTININWGQN